jgi:hypothetical protein
VGLIPEVSWPLYRESFDEAFFYGMTNAQVTVGNYTFVESWSGLALQRSGDPVTPFFVPGVDAVQTNLNCDKGTFRFWFKHYWSSVTQTDGVGPGAVATLLELDAIGNKKSANVWSLQISPDGTMLSLIAQSDDSPTLLLQTEINWQANQSHLIALDYSTKETALFLDGQLVAQGAGTLAVPPQVAALFVGSSLAGKSVAGGDFDELCCFGKPPMARFYHPLTAIDLLFYYNVYAPNAALGPVSAEEIAEREKRMAERKAQRAAALSAGMSLGGAGQMSMMDAVESDGGGANGPDSLTDSTNLWIEVPTNALAVTNQFAVILRNTIPGQPYDVLTKQALNQSTWTVEIPAMYAETNSMLVQLFRNGRTNLFVWARFAGDSTGTGIPDWWWLTYFGTTSNVDAYADPDGDGWNNLDEYENETSPTIFDTPPPLIDINVTIDGSGHNVISWSAPTVVPVTFTIQRNTGSGFQTIANISGSLSSYTDTNLPPNTSASYRVKADYPSGSSGFATYNFTTIDPLLNMPTAVTAGTGGRLFVPYSKPSTVVTSLWVVAQSVASYYPKDGMYAVNSSYPYTVFYGNNNTPSGSVPAGNLTGAPLMLSTGFVPNYGFYTFKLYTAGQNGKYGALVQPGWTASAVPFLDGRQHMFDNLNFILRAGTVSESFDFFFSTIPYNQTGAEDYGIFPTYTTAGYNGKNGGSGGGYLNTYDWIDELQPFEDGSILRDFCYSSNRFDSFGNPLDAGFGGFTASLPLVNSWNFYFSSLAYAQAHNTNTPPRQLDSTNAQYIFYGPSSDGHDISDLGLTWDNSIPGWRLSSNARNIYGLQILSVRAVKVTQSAQPLSVYTASAGGTIPALTSSTDPNGDGWFYFQAETPGFQNVGWHVAAGILESRFGPGFPSWNGTNTIDVPILNVGDEIHMAAWAKLLVTNASFNSVSYLQHYFDKAYKIGASGIATTNQTGILSEYGDFFATEPGATALITKPDLATGLSCTSVVQVIALNADANHDGVLDFTFAGPDYVTTNNPFRFWVNDNQDDGDDTGDGIPGKQGTAADGQNFAYLNNFVPVYQVHGTRDLVDFFPVYLNIGGLVSTLPPSSSVRYFLRQRDEALRFAYTDLSATNYMNFLRDTNTALALADTQLTTIPISGVELPSSFLNGIATQGKGIILVEAWTNTTSPLMLEVWQGTNLVGQTELALSITGVEEMFRHKNLIRAMNPSSGAGMPDRLASADVPNEPQTGTNNFIFLHGYNVNPNQARGWLADIYKRFYWSGSHAKFYGVTYQGSDGQ